ncbi:hypothetical protein QA640_16845 [Bradyrhizobium sp. CB82]|uniref:hypothetical protein n=1 Tax=Bradyrhizobium sp. CB82 TaxID=3039159 RepID=UPI0024B1C985|nr:hypothetical protein [Bradyrhizobium sp. CB82]WFU43965.1 hypothetical protein QA640_16845 [Bradyrhizobium sp. CB82]
MERHIGRTKYTFEAVAWNGISAGADTFTFNSGDKAKLTKGGVDLKAAGSEKLSSTKK